ncbi:MAG TPA: nucleotidyltransferase domain-containing protein [Geminicoccaceae bacterium]|nr:nucleotidyltransferase domain-containing protein [Geminicoccaceae bacterium]
MPLRNEVIAKLRAHESELRAAGMEALFLFGSVAEGEDRPGSDIDLFFDHKSGLGLEVVGLQERVREILPGEVDITTRRSLHPLLRPRIEAAALRVF